MLERVNQFLWIAIAAILALLAVGVLSIVIIAALDGRLDPQNPTAPPVVVSPRVAFEANQAALEAGNYELSTTFIKDDCTVGFAAGVADPQAALDDLLASGFVFEEEFEVDQVWISEDGTQAILGLLTSPTLPDIATLELVDGEWLLAC